MKILFDMRYLVLLVLFGISNCMNAEDTIRIAFAGDIMGHDAQIESAWDSVNNSYNYEPTFRYVSEYISSVDLAIANLEVTLAGPPFKGYPQFSSPDELAVEAKKAGFDVMLTANNHSLDRGTKGFKRTLNILDSLGFMHTGTFMNDSAQAADHPLYVNVKGIKIALLNYTYGTNGLKVPEPYKVSRINWAEIKREIALAKKDSADFIIVATHWGTEYQLQESEKQQKLAQYILNLGADAIIGSHPHVVQPIKYLSVNSDTANKKPVVYSLGNFVSNQRARYKDGGIIVELSLVKSVENTDLIDLKYIPTWVYKEKKNNETTFYILPVTIYTAREKDFNFNSDNIYRIDRFAGDTRKQLDNVTEIILE
jgi:poly-gamma-glutamate capsule biosynthesis protein CapA/YwtB (metallophosphatase superfamily)